MRGKKKDAKLMSRQPGVQDGGKSCSQRVDWQCKSRVSRLHLCRRFIAKLTEESYYNCKDRDQSMDQRMRTSGHRHSQIALHYVSGPQHSRSSNPCINDKFKASTEDDFNVRPETREDTVLYANSRWTES